MSNVKINTDLFLGKQELRRFERFLKNDGYIRYADMSLVRFGILNDYVNDSQFNNLKVVTGTSPSDISLNSGFGLDENFNIINVPSNLIDVEAIPNDNTYRYVSIQYATTNIEVGTVDILANGTVTGTNTLFTEVLRSQPNFASRIRFPNSTLNTNIYEVVTVTDDLNIIISGNLQAETGVEYIVVGTFTPDKIIPAPQQDVFVYDSFLLTVGLTDISNDTTIFNLAKVKTDGLTMVLEDLRSSFIETKASYELRDIQVGINDLIGIEQIKYDTQYSAKDENLVRLGWGFKGTNWTIDVELGIITIQGGDGGIWKTPADFVAGSFDSWRCYFKGSGKFYKIITSIKNGSYIDLSLRGVNSDEITAGVLANDVYIVPNADDILLEFEAVDSPNTRVEYLLPISNCFADLKVKINPTMAETIVKYRYVHNSQETEVRLIKDGDYFNETAFDNDGYKINNNTSTVSAAQYTSLVHADNYYLQKAWRNKSNIFLENNTFNKAIGLAYDGIRDITLSASPDVNPVIDIGGSTNGNYYKLTDTTTQGEFHFIKNDNNNSTAFPVTLEIRADVVLKHNQTPTGAEVADGYAMIYNQGGLDINLFVGDFILIVNYGNQWNVVNVWRKDGALDTNQANLFPITGLDNKCFSFVDNKLGTILQDIITNLCNMQTGNAYGFHASKTANQPLDTDHVIGTETIITFEDDLNAPYFDNGNDMYIDKYIVPEDGIKQKFIVESLKGSALTASGSFTIGIYVDGVAQVTASHGVGSTLNIPSIATGYLTLTAGQVVDVRMKVTGAGTAIALLSGARFSNSF